MLEHRRSARTEDFAGNGSTTTTNGDLKYTDPLANATACARDIPYLVALRTNTIRTYAIDPTQDHTKCMQLLSDAGIYVISDLGEPANSINRDTPEWNAELYARYTAVVDNMAKFNNLLGFFAGNEVSNAPNNTIASAFVKAAVRDTKAYIAQKKYRPIGVGYATNDDETRTNLANYFNCGPASDSIDFWGYNIYSWCGESNYQDSHYEERTQEFSTYDVPAFFAEYGCNKVNPRPFDEVGTLFGRDMAQVWSGGIVYMYFEEANHFGLVSVSPDDTVSAKDDFTSLSSQMAKVTPSGPSLASYSPTNSPQACPTIGSNWEAVTKLPPSPNTASCDCMVSNLTCVAKSGISDEDIQTQFDFLCDPRQGNNCGGVLANASTGVYGAWSMCSASQRLSWAFNHYYENQTATNSQNSNPCDFKGAAQKVTPKPAGSCKAVISQAGAAGTGAVTNAPTATAGGSSGSGSTSSSSGAAGAVSIPSIDFTLVKLGAYMTLAMIVGVAMVLL
ncbi:uncharacterized protein KY384_005915 [Bacidia gigantensis]|uniref:uncharacterized protein n=1 Tax=Bacidia gigantensis TaxID=2732470 RepID=UPI001D04408A|nr:uncharacterized protein KY384_005915 [Bacidia gigantensis]KAG8529280.1 hypothetical protein KY384_005915 [Bacidia gigantensis]